MQHLRLELRLPPRGYARLDTPMSFTIRHSGIEPVPPEPVACFHRTRVAYYLVQLEFNAASFQLNDTPPFAPTSSQFAYSFASYYASSSYPCLLCSSSTLSIAVITTRQARSLVYTSGIPVNVFNVDNNIAISSLSSISTLVQLEFHQV